MSARLFDCPQCGAPVTFRSSVTVFAVCEHCRSMVVARDASVETMGVMAELPPDLSPFRIGTKGLWEGRAFEIMGRVRVEWEEGSWNEWCILYDANHVGWLAEAQGLLMISFAIDPEAQIPPDPATYRPGKIVKLAGRYWTVTDIKQTVCRASEGELPFVAPPKGSRFSIDLSSSDAGFASLEFSGESPALYVGKYVPFDDFRFTDLRPVPGWDAEIAEEKNKTNALACPSCGAPVNLRAAGQSMAAVCGNCGTVIDTGTPELRIVQKAAAAQRKLNPLLPIGQRGKLFGVEYEVIGLVVRRDKDSNWTEYLLFNPWHGFQWLVTFQGHWTYVTRLPAQPDATGQVATLDGRSYRLYAKGGCEVTAVLGEFYWKVRRGEKADLADYIAPPYILSRESYPELTEVAWSSGVYVEPTVIGAAFGVKDLPRREGLYLNQPNPAAARWKEIRAPFFGALAVLFCIQVYFDVNRPTAPVASSSFVYRRTQPSAAPSASLPPATGPVAPATDTSKVFVTPHFRVDGFQQRLAVTADARVDNSWLDLDLELVNAQSNQTIPADMEVSYYHGYDDGYWTEGSQTADATFPGVPPGEYFLTVEPSGDPGIETLPFTIRVSKGGIFASNFFISLLLILVYPAVLCWRRRAFENERWADSDY